METGMEMKTCEDMNVSPCSSLLHSGAMCLCVRICCCLHILMLLCMCVCMLSLYRQRLFDYTACLILYEHCIEVTDCLSLYCTLLL